MEGYIDMWLIGPYFRETSGWEAIEAFPYAYEVLGKDDDSDVLRRS